MPREGRGGGQARPPACPARRWPLRSHVVFDLYRQTMAARGPVLMQVSRPRAGGEASVFILASLPSRARSPLPPSLHTHVSLHHPHPPARSAALRPLPLSLPSLLVLFFRFSLPAAVASCVGRPKPQPLSRPSSPAGGTRGSPRRTRRPVPPSPCRAVRAKTPLLCLLSCGAQRAALPCPAPPPSPARAVMVAGRAATSPWRRRDSPTRRPGRAPPLPGPPTSTAARPPCEATRRAQPRRDAHTHATEPC